jgi:transposase
MVDTSEQALQVRVPGRKRVWRTKAERRAIVEETLVPGASVSRVSRRHDVNANQVFRWRKLYSEGQLGTTTNFLPVKIANERSLEARKEDDLLPRSGTMEIQLSKGTLRIVGSVDVLALRAVIECLV